MLCFGSNRVSVLDRFELSVSKDAESRPDDDKCYDFLSECLTKSLRKIQFSFEERKKLVELTFLNKKRFPIERISKLSGVPVKALELWRGNDYKVFIDKDLLSQSIVLEKQPQTSGNIKEIEKLF